MARIPRGGRRNRLVTIQERTKARGTAGGISITWRDWGTTWASIDQLSGREAEYARSTVPLATHIARMPYVAGLIEGMRFTLDGQAYNVESVNDVGFERVVHECILTADKGKDA